ncbi:MAG TPA: hypothetical protein VEZ14_01270 [Dehalococcoidia bacterium]|nr:hypothetical protein [Dehalococcoidia bacterium]
MGVVISELFLDENGYDLIVANDELANFTMALASSEPPMTLASIARWLRAHTRRRSGATVLAVGR